MNDMCNCQIEYRDFKTGMTFNEIRQMLKAEAKRKYQKGQYMFITRHTVLGRWHQLKKELWKNFQDALDKEGCECSLS